MAWDDRDGRDFTAPFHPCWLTKLLVKLYEPHMPMFLSNDLEAVDTCFPPEPAVKKGRHRVVCMQSGQWSTRARQQPLAEDDYEDAQGNLFKRYLLQDDLALVEPVPRLPTLGTSHERHPGDVRRSRRRGRPRGGNGTSRGKCSKCKRTSHNHRTCIYEVGQGSDAMHGQRGQGASIAEEVHAEDQHNDEGPLPIDVDETVGGQPPKREE